MTDYTIIEAAELANLTVDYFNCPTQMYSAADVATKLSKHADRTITVDDVKAFRIKYMNEQVHLPAPIISEPIRAGMPTSLEEMCSYAMIDTMGLRNGVVIEAYEICKQANIDKDLKTALNALNTLLKGADSLDAKLRQLSPRSDPASLILKSDEFNKFKNILIEIDANHPEIHLWELYREEAERQAVIEETLYGTEEIVHD